MAVRQLKDGRWVCYYRFNVHSSKVQRLNKKSKNQNPERRSRLKFEYFGRGATGEVAAWARHNELNLQPRRNVRPSFGPLFADLAREYGAHKVFNENSRSHLWIRLNAHILPAFFNLHATKITDQHCDNYVIKRQKDGVKYSTIHRELADIQAILNWSAARRPPLIPFNPIRNYKKPARDDDIIIPPSQEETARILAHAPDHLKRYILLSYYLGLRPGAVELLSIQWNQLNWETESILIISAHKGGPEKRLVPVHDDLLPLLTKWAHEDQPASRLAGKNRGYIVHIRGRPMQSIKTSWKGALRRAGISRRLRPYDLRHHFITRALEKGGDLKALSEIVGSRPETITKHYQHVTRELHRKTIEKIPSLAIQSIAKK